MVFILRRVIFEPDAEVQRYGRLDFPVILEIAAKDAAAESLDGGRAAVAEPAAGGDARPEIGNSGLTATAAGCGCARQNHFAGVYARGGVDGDVAQDSFIARIGVVVAFAE